MHHFKLTCSSNSTRPYTADTEKFAAVDIAVAATLPLSCKPSKNCPIMHTLMAIIEITHNTRIIMLDTREQESWLFVKAVIHARSIQSVTADFSMADEIPSFPMALADAPRKPLIKAFLFRVDFLVENGLIILLIFLKNILYRFIVLFRPSFANFQ